MHYSPGNRALALIVGLLVAATGPAMAQDTTEMGGAPMDTAAAPTGAIDTAGVDSAVADTSDTSATDTSATDTSGVQNPPGYRGMERDTTMFPDSGGPPAEAGQVEDRATGTHEDSAWQDTTGAEQNPAGYRGMEASGDTAAGGVDSTTVGDTEPKEDESATPRIEPSESAAGDTAAPQ
jgi:hypothetical protein